MTGWMETAIGIGAALSPIGVAGVSIADTITGGGGGVDIAPAPAGMAVVGGVEVQGPLNIVEIEGVPIETPGGGTVPQPFNDGTIGLVPYHENKGDTIDEIVKQGPPAKDPPTDPSRIPEDSKSQTRKYLEDLLKLFTPPNVPYEGPFGPLGFLRLFALEEGTPEYEAYVAGKKEPPTNLNLNPDTPPAEKENKWNPEQTWGDFLKGFQKGFEKDQEVGFWDTVLGFVNISQWPLMAVIAGGVLLVIVILR